MVKEGRIRIAIVEDDEKLRAELASIVSGEGSFLLVGQCASPDEALATLPGAQPDVTLMDINFNGEPVGIECVRRLKKLMPDAEFMMVSVFENTELIYASLRAGAMGYMLKRVEPEKLIQAIKELHGKGAPMSPSIARKVLKSFRNPADLLTMREYEVLKALAKGRIYKEIAEHLGISVNTVRSYTYRIYQKLQVRSKAEAVAKLK